MKYLQILYMSLFLISCKDQVKNVRIDNEKVLKVSKKYSKEAFNYFYEIGFFDEGLKKSIPLRKWNTNVKIFIKGNPLINDVKYVKDCIGKINEVRLPIKFILVENINDSNVLINFGNIKDFTNINIDNTVDGFGNVYSKKHIIYKAEIFILDKIINSIERESLILEELTQIAVAGADSFSYPNSVFYQGKNSPLKYTSLDIEVMKLAYDPILPIGYQLEQFEKDFNNKLNYVDIHSKLKKYITKEKLKKEILAEIRNTCFINNEFFKHPKEVSIYLNGFNESDSLLVQKYINTINKISKNLFLKLTEKNNLIPSSGISITLTPNDEQSSDTQTSIKNNKGLVFKPKRYESIVDISYKNSVDINKKHSVIFKSIYKSLGATETKNFDENWYIIENDKILLAKKYKDILKTIYQDEFVDGLKIDDFDEIINEIY